MTKENLFSSIQKVYDSWRGLTSGTREYVIGLQTFIPVIPPRAEDTIEQEYNQAMEALDDLLLSVAPMDNINKLSCSNIVSDEENAGIRYEQTTMDLRKAICAEVYQILFDNNFIWTESNGTGIWVSTAGIFAYSDSEGITSACSEECLEQILTTDGKYFKICADKRKDDFDDEEKFFFTLKLIDDD